MKTRLTNHLLIIGLSVASALACLGAAPYAKLQDTPPAESSNDSKKSKEKELQDRFQDEVIVHINKERSKAGLMPLRRQKELMDAALWHAKDMLKNEYFDHTDSLGRENKARVKAFKYENTLFTAENIASGQENPLAVVDSWMKSEKHKANILDKLCKEIGVGFFPPSQFTSMNFWVVNFGARNEVFPVVVNMGSAMTYEANVMLHIHGEGWAKEMRISNDGTTWSNWEPYQSKKAWELVKGEGEKKIYLELRKDTTVKSDMTTVMLTSKKEVASASP